MNGYNSVTVLALETLRESSFQDRHKVGSNSFTRNRKLPFIVVAGMVFRMVKTSLQIACNWLGELVGMDQAVSKQAFSRARQKISPECFQDIHEECLRSYYGTIQTQGLWRGFRLIACDGSTIRLPESADLARAFGRHQGHDGEVSPPMARLSEFTDMTSKVVLSGRIAPYSVSEEALAKEQLVEVVRRMRRDSQGHLLFVYDRGYPSEEFINQHVELGVDFIFRVPRNFNRGVKQAHERGDAESVVLREEWPLLRLAQFKLSSGEDELLLTTLTDEEKYPQKVLSELYRGRWTAMEEGYKKQKIAMELENFSGKTEVAVRQEYWATLTVANLIEIGCIESEGYWIPGDLPKKRANRSVVFGSTRDVTMKAILGMVTIEEYGKYVDGIIERAKLSSRPDRQYSRAKVNKPKRHHVYRRAC